LVANTDVSWLLTAAEKVLDGQRLYIDIIELNPPASIYLYVPAVLIARLCGLPPEAIVDCLVLLAACTSIWISGRILTRAHLLDGIDGWNLAAISAAILLIIPAQTLGEREHIAVIALLPFLAALIGRARGQSPEPWAVIVAGIGAGTMIVIKPHLALGAVAAMTATAFCSRSLRILLMPETFIAGIAVAVYGVTVSLLFPQFIADVLPMTAAVYVPVKVTFSGMLAPVWIWLLTILLSIVAIRRRNTQIAAHFIVLFVTSIGFGLEYFIQGKGWPYHSYPMLALALLALAIAFLEPEPAPVARLGMRLAASLAVLIALACPIWLWMNLADDKSYLAEPIRQLKPHPTMLTITSNIALGHPLVRQVGGVWVGTVCSLWITFGTMYQLRNLLPESPLASRLKAYADRDRTMLLADIRQHRPDIIVVERSPADWSTWAQSDPSVAEELQAYVPAAVTRDAVILQRSDEFARNVDMSAVPAGLPTLAPATLLNLTK
jgi:hypothetical protein